tara:strand:- start:7867 stop:8781 length:915 start_codon:yes stop_codon:yes gene_type:complete
MKLKPHVRIDAFAITLPRHISPDPLAIYEAAICVFNKTSSVTGEKEIPTSRYKASLRIPLRQICKMESIRQVPHVFIELTPRNEAADSPLRIDFKGFPYSDEEWSEASKIVKQLLSISDNTALSMEDFVVTRFDVAFDVSFDLLDLLFYKKNTKVTEVSYGIGGRIRCVRLGRSKSKRYVVIYTKDWRPHRDAELAPEGFTRIEVRTKPRVSVFNLLDEVNIEEINSSLALYDTDKVKKSGIFKKEMMRLIKHFGISPAVMSCKTAKRRKLLSFLERYRIPLLTDAEILQIRKKLNRELKTLFK